MKITKSALVTRKEDSKSVHNTLARASAGKDISSTPTDIIKHVRTLLNANKLSLEDIIKIYRDIVEMKLKGTKVSDVVKVLESVQRIHLAQVSALDDATRALESKNEEELADYTRVTLKKTEVILERLQARRINNNAPERSSTS